MINPIMFMAHLLPFEERRAILTNWPGLLRKKFKQYFSSVDLHYNAIVISSDSEFKVRLLSKIDRISESLTVLKPFSFRFIIRGNK
jgi:hypothetical protein